MMGGLRRPSVRRPYTISNEFSSETTRPIAIKLFHIQPPGPLGKKSCLNGLGHMTNMAAMPLYGKNLKLEKVSIGHGCPRQMPFRKRVYM